MLVEQLQSALHHRVTIEQAKGVLAEHGQLPMHTAYETLRDYARQNGQHLSELARDITAGTIDTMLLLPGNARPDLPG